MIQILHEGEKATERKSGGGSLEALENSLLILSLV